MLPINLVAKKISDKDRDSLQGLLFGCNNKNALWCFFFYSKKSTLPTTDLAFYFFSEALWPCQSFRASESLRNSRTIPNSFRELKFVIKISNVENCWTTRAISKGTSFNWVTVLFPQEFRCKHNEEYGNLADYNFNFFAFAQISCTGHSLRSRSFPELSVLRFTAPAQ